MPLTCPRGHQWEAAAELSRQPELPLVCPVCAAAKLAPPSPSDTDPYAKVDSPSATPPPLPDPYATRAPAAEVEPAHAEGAQGDVTPPTLPDPPPALDPQATLDSLSKPGPEAGPDPLATHEAPSPDGLAPAADPYPRLAPTRNSEHDVTLNPCATVNTPQSRPLAQAPSVQEDYELLDELGRGGMGVVYKARQVKLKRLVALKMILGAHAGQEQLDRFRSEAEAVARLQHPHIVQIYEVGERDGQPFFSLEFVDGGSLDKKIAGTPQPPREAAQLVETLAQAMHAAHVKGIVHRDLKPANVLLAQDGTPKITDFGLAKQLNEESGQTLSGAIMGSPSYMAPEQAEGQTRAIGPPADIYALGAILYELLTGRPPFRGTTVWETLDQVRTQEPVPPRRFQPSVPLDLQTICLKCLEKDKAKRYVTAEALADDLRRYLNGEPIQARPTSAWERLRKWARRKPAQAALIAALAVAVLGGTVGAVFYARYKDQQADVFRDKYKRLEQSEQDRKKIERQWLTARKLMADDNWGEARTQLVAALHALEVQRDLPAGELRAEIQRSLQVAEQRLGEDRKRQQARGRGEAFRKPYDDALFYATLFTGRSLTEDRDRTRASARAALKLYGLDEASDRPGRLEQDRPHLHPAEYARLAGACYELLLLWADVEASPPVGKAGGPKQSRKRGQRALALLDRARRLGRAHGLDTRAYHLRRARYQAQVRGEAFDPDRVSRKAPARPTGALDWFLEGLERHRQGRYQEASLACAETLRREGGHFWARYVLALCRLRAGRWLEAKAELTVCLNRRPGFVWPRVLRGFAAGELAARLPDKQLAAAEFRAAQDDLDRALRQDRDPLVQYVALTDRGVLHLSQQQWKEAERDLRAALKVKPSGFQAHANLAQALKGLRRWDEALVELNEAIRLQPDLAELYGSRARLRLLLQDRTGARADFEQAVAREPKGSRSDRLVNNLVQLGRLLHRQREFPAALGQYERALRLQPAFLLAERFRAETLLALGRQQEAGRALDRYLAGTREPAPEVFQARGLLYDRAGQLLAAIDMYCAGLHLRPNDVVTRSLRGWTYLQTDAVRLALEDFEACLRQQPDNVNFLVGRGSARIRLRQLNEAVADAEAALRRGPLTEQLLYALACLYAQAAAQVEAKPRSGWGRAGLPPSGRYAEKSLACLRRALQALPGERRASFWRKQVETDPLLKPVQRGGAYRRLAARYGGL